jgi:hypothetical protein
MGLERHQGVHRIPLISGILRLFKQILLALRGRKQMRKALVVGIDHYPNSPLSGCVNDAKRMCELMSRNQDGSVNFGCRDLVSSPTIITRAVLKEAIDEVFSGKMDVAFFFFAGHGTVNNLGGYLVTQDASRYDEGVSMADVIALANKSQSRECIIVLDCCHSGALGQIPALANNQVILREGVSVLSACRDTESAMESGGGGIFTSLICDGLRGGAADVCGKVTAASLYAYVDETLGVWQQRPLFKTHVSRLTSLRTCAPAVPPEILRLLPRYFPQADSEYQLDPSHEPDAQPSHPENEKTFGHLQKCRTARLVEPVGEDHMYFAAMKNKTCRLTPLGRFYWHRANSGDL